MAIAAAIERSSATRQLGYLDEAREIAGAPEADQHARSVEQLGSTTTSTSTRPAPPRAAAPRRCGAPR
jgi:hypothetical protein